MYRLKKSTRLVVLVAAATVFAPVNASAGTETDLAESTQNNASQSSVSSEVAEKADSYVFLQGDQFAIAREAESALSQKELQEIKNEVETQNERISEAKADSNLEMKVAGDSITFWEKGPKISSADDDDIDPYFQEGRNGIEFHGTYVRVLLSKTTINRVGGGVTIAGVWIPEPLLSKILATGGAIAGLAPGGMYADYGIGSIVAGAFTHNAYPQRVGFQ